MQSGRSAASVGESSFGARSVVAMGLVDLACKLESVPVDWRVRGQREG